MSRGAVATSQDRCDVSVIVPSFNPGPLLFDCLRSLFSQRTKYSYEVIVVDSSPRDIAEDLAERFPQARVIHLPQRAYPGTARNFGIAVARGEVLAFTDADCIVSPDWIEKLMEAQRGATRVVGGPIGNGTPDSLLGTAHFLLEFSSFQADRGGTRRVEVLPTGNVAYPKSLFREYGGFDSSIKGSDSVFSRSLLRQGVGLYLVPGMRLLHRNYTSWDSFLRNQYQLGIGSALTRRKLRLRDSFMVRAPILAPLIPFARTIAIAYRLVRWSPANFVRFVFLYPLCFLGLLVFTAGFLRGLRSE
ncbi:MAG: glycosyltransferase [candidate division KSB1 bacterium]|nr:glycosyltransferase [candidate division KSB1 bacterium]